VFDASTEHLGGAVVGVRGRGKISRGCECDALTGMGVSA